MLPDCVDRDAQTPALHSGRTDSKKKLSSLSDALRLLLLLSYAHNTHIRAAVNTSL